MFNITHSRGYKTGYQLSSFLLHFSSAEWLKEKTKFNPI